MVLTRPPCRRCFFRAALKTVKHQMTGRAVLLIGVTSVAVALCAAQTRRRSSRATSTQAAKSASKYSAFLHSSNKHQSLKCDACHKIPTAWTAKRDFPDVADFPDHNSCVGCHRQQFFTRQAFSGTGPVICTVCHLRAAPREDARFAFGKPNNSNQVLKQREERQFTIEFPHDKHQNVIASLMPEAQSSRLHSAVQARALALQSLRRQSFVRASFSQSDDKKPDYNNCSICHQRNDDLVIAPLAPSTGDNSQSNKFFKTMPRSHDACFECHWKNQKPAGADCGGCHKASVAFVTSLAVKRISAKFSHEGGKGEHVMECTTCHINITRAASLRGLTPDVPIAACTTCHKDSKKTTYPKAVTLEEEFEQYKKTGACTYCHATDIGKKKPPASHDAAAQ
jgi:Cytochrome c7 and related cytochrome c